MDAEPLVEVRIESLAGSGDGVAHDAQGRVLFVPFTAPGDLVRVRVVEARRRWARGRVETRLEDGPQRVEPRCPVFGACGGCAWQHVAYAAQLDAKARILADALERIGKLAPPVEIVVVPCPAPYGHRARTRVRVEHGRVGYSRRRSHALCAVRGCPLLTPTLDRALGELAAHPPAGTGSWELAAGADGHVHVTRLPAHEAPSGPISIEAAGEKLELSPGTFFQSNAPLREALLGAVLDAAGAGETAVELFAGAGFFTLPLARRCARLLAVEADARTARDLRRNLARAGLADVSVLEVPVEQALGDAELRRARPQLVVLDPPRTGLPGGAAAALAKLSPARVVYVSCDPATLARDLAKLAEAGYALRDIQAFDLFPQTPHVEALAILERRDPHDSG